MTFERVSSGAVWEKKIGYCRALKAGPMIFVSGSAPVGEDGQVVGPGDPYLQAKRCFEIIRQSLAKLDCPLSAVVRTRLFVSDISRWQEYGRAHQEYFGDFPPTTTMVEVKGLVDPSMLIEVEADAYLG